MNKCLSLLILVLMLFITGCSSFMTQPCPQINVSIIPDVIPPYMRISEYDGWKIDSDDFNTFVDYGPASIKCNLGEVEGQRPDYLYCGYNDIDKAMPVMEKTFINTDGTIGKTIKQSFFNVYIVDTSSKNKYLFKETICSRKKVS